MQRRGASKVTIITLLYKKKMQMLEIPGPAGPTPPTKGEEGQVSCSHVGLPLHWGCILWTHKTG